MVLFKWFESYLINKKPFKLNFYICLKNSRKSRLLSDKVKYCSTFNNMKNRNLLDPPENVNGMKVLDRNCFQKSVLIPCLEITKSQIMFIMKPLKNYFLKVVKIKAVQEINQQTQRILINPCLVEVYEDFDESIKAQFNILGINKNNFNKICLNLTYENWGAAPLLKAVLPKNEPPLTSYSTIGHIIHLNIKDHLLEYKYVIAHILLDKVNYAKTVVYKKNTIDNVFRTFEMEVLCGEPNFIVSVIEYGMKFEFDFSKVYWNPRLSTEHHKIVKMIQAGDVLFDVFAGVGPFAIQAAIKKCLVFANDLNPDSYHWLNHNIKLNKKSIDYITTFNKDGGEFILNDLKNNLLKIWKNRDFSGKIYFVMNLPATGLTFLKYYKGLLDEKDLADVEIEHVKKFLPVVHCHFFVKQPETIKEVFKRDSNIEFDKNEHTFFFVRNVSTGKAMHRVTFQLPLRYLINFSTEIEEPLPKRHCSNNQSKFL